MNSHNLHHPQLQQLQRQQQQKLQPVSGITALYTTTREVELINGLMLPVGTEFYPVHSENLLDHNEQEYFDSFFDSLLVDDELFNGEAQFPNGLFNEQHQLEYPAPPPPQPQLMSNIPQPRMVMANNGLPQMEGNYGMISFAGNSNSHETTLMQQHQQQQRLQPQQPQLQNISHAQATAAVTKTKSTNAKNRNVAQARIIAELMAPIHSKLHPSILQAFPPANHQTRFQDVKVDLQPRKKRHQSKELLSEEEKKANHIASEQKRRQNIRNGFHILSMLISANPRVRNGTVEGLNEDGDILEGVTSSATSACSKNIILDKGNSFYLKLC